MRWDGLLSPPAAESEKASHASHTDTGTDAGSSAEWESEWGDYTWAEELSCLPRWKNPQVFVAFCSQGSLMLKKKLLFFFWEIEQCLWWCCNISNWVLTLPFQGWNNMSHFWAERLRQMLVAIEIQLVAITCHRATGRGTGMLCERVRTKDPTKYWTYQDESTAWLFTV